MGAPRLVFAAVFVLCTACGLVDGLLGGDAQTPSNDEPSGDDAQPGACDGDALFCSCNSTPADVSDCTCSSGAGGCSCVNSCECSGGTGCSCIGTACQCEETCIAAPIGSRTRFGQVRSAAGAFGQDVAISSGSAVCDGTTCTCLDPNGCTASISAGLATSGAGAFACWSDANGGCKAVGTTETLACTAEGGCRCSGTPCGIESLAPLGCGTNSFACLGADCRCFINDSVNCAFGDDCAVGTANDFADGALDEPLCAGRSCQCIASQTPPCGPS